MKGSAELRSSAGAAKGKFIGQCSLSDLHSPRVLYLVWLSYINIVFRFREVNEDNMVFRNISAEFLEDTIVLVSTINKSA